MESAESASDVKMKLHIVQAATTVLADTTFEDMSIKQICSEAHISRPTFYRYFPNKESLPTWHIDHFFRIGSFQIGRTLTWYEGHYVELPNGCPPLRQYSTKMHAENLKETLVSFRGITLTDRLAFQVEAFAKTRTDITKKWVCGGMEPPPSIFAEFTNSVVPSELFALLDIPSARMVRKDHG